MTTWLPLESNPDVLTRYIHGLGVTPLWALTDVFGFEAEQTQWLPNPIKAVILLYPCSAKLEKYSQEVDAELLANPPNLPNELLFVKQYIHNACGTIALLHAIANNKDIELQEGSVLEKYLHAARELSAEQRGKLLEGFIEISEFHKESALEGQTDANSVDPVDHHFVTFINHEGELYELDGRKSFPVKHGKTSADTLLEDVGKICNNVMQRVPGDLGFSVIALVPNVF